MNRKQKYLLVAILLLIWILSISIFYNNLADGPDHVRWFSDHHDRLVYMERGEWLPQHKIPYVDIPSEYPQVPTYLFGLLFLTLPSGEPQVQYFIYSSLFSSLMLVFLFLTIHLIHGMLQEKKWLSFLLLLPGTLYFTFNRFDILPAYLLLLSLYYVKRQKSVLAAIFLGLAVFTKWYPVLLLPLFLAFDLNIRKRMNWKFVLAFGITCFVITIPTFIQGGVKALLAPLILHSGRGLEQVSLFALINQIFLWFGWMSNSGFLINLSLLMQFVPPILGFFAKIDTDEKLNQWIIISISAYILFSRIYSPQWLLWLVPFLIIAVRKPIDIVLIVLYNLATYFAFPFAMDQFGMDSIYYKIGGALSAVLLFIFMGIAIHRATIQFSARSLLAVLQKKEF